jgi:phage protein U
MFILDIYKLTKAFLGGGEVLKFEFSLTLVRQGSKRPLVLLLLVSFSDEVSQFCPARLRPPSS